MLDQLKDKVQRDAVKAWLNNNKIGTFQLTTGTGKTIAALHCLYTMPKNGKVHLFLAETVERERDLKKDILLYNQLFNVNVLKDYQLVFKCYQSVFRLKGYEFGLVIADEIHNSLSPEYSQFYFNNKYDSIVGLSATVDRDTSYFLDGVLTTKGDLIDKIAPVCFTYTINQAQQEGTSRKLNIYVIYQELDSVNKTIPAGNAITRFFQTEKQSYDYWDSQHQKAWFILDYELKNLKLRTTASKRSKLLFELPSKVNTVKQILQFIKGKTILFGNNLDSLLKITPDVVSSRNSIKENKKIRDDFDQGWIKLIGSFKKLRQGANLKELDNCIIMSYYSSEVHAIQQFGRLRKNGEKDGSIFILLTRDTQEEKWFEKMTQNIIDDFNIIYCKDIEECKQKYKENEINE